MKILPYILRLCNHWCHNWCCRHTYHVRTCSCICIWYIGTVCRRNLDPRGWVCSGPTTNLTLGSPCASVKDSERTPLNRYSSPPSSSMVCWSGPLPHATWATHASQPSAHPPRGSAELVTGVAPGGLYLASACRYNRCDQHTYTTMRVHCSVLLVLGSARGLVANARSETLSARLWQPQAPPHGHNEGAPLAWENRGLTRAALCCRGGSTAAASTSAAAAAATGGGRRGGGSCLGKQSTGKGFAKKGWGQLGRASSSNELISRRGVSWFAACFD